MPRYWTDFTGQKQRSKLPCTYPFSFLSNSTTMSNMLVSLEDFVREHDHVVYGISSPDPSSTEVKSSSPLHALKDLVNIHVVNSFNSPSELHAHLDKLDLLNPEHLRPAWDTYFMVCSASLSYKCMNLNHRRLWLPWRHIVRTA